MGLDYSLSVTIPYDTLYINISIYINIYIYNRILQLFIPDLISKYLVFNN